MNTAFRVRLLVPAIACCILAGCDRPPAAPRVVSSENTNALTVRQDNDAEVAAATAMEAARVNYHHRLEVLRDYYEHVGNADKYLAARKEIASLEQAQAFNWAGLPEIVPPEREPIAGVDERMLVEYVVAARNDFLAAADDLLGLYQAEGNTYRAAFIKSIKDRFDPVRTYLYFASAEIPGPELRPTEVIPDADEMFAQAYKLFIQGKGILHTFVTTDYQKERQALQMFLDLVRKYPTSTKIALSAYYIGDIYKEYFNEDVRAVLWYQRAWQWDPTITKPARFQAATVYDLRLHNPEKAVECYKGAVQYEQFNQSNVRFATNRIAELTGQR